MGGVGKVAIEFVNLGGELCDAKSAVRGVVTEKDLVAHFLEMGWGIASDSSGNHINKQLALLDIRTGG